MIEDAFVAALEEVPDLVVRAGEPAARHTTLRLGGPIDLWLLAETEAAAGEAARLASAADVPLRPWSAAPDWVLDGGLGGAWMALGGAARGMTRDGLMVDVGTEVGASVFACWAEAEGLAGVEALAGRAGTVASAWRAGHVAPVAVRALRGSVFSWAKQASANRVATSLRLALRPMVGLGDYAEARQARRGEAEGLPGRLMKDSEHVTAARAIAEAGLCGVRLRQLRVGEREPNALVHLGGGSSADHRLLVKMIKDRVKTVSGVELEVERRPVGRS